MDPRNDLPAEIAQFVTDNLDCVEQLELLTMLMESPDNWWDAASAGQAIGVSADRARRHLERLATRNLFAVSLTSEIRYRFDPGTPPLRQACDTLANLFQQNRRALLRLVAGSPRASVRQFADAFRIRRRDNR